MLPYDGITRTGSEGDSHFAAKKHTKTPSESRKLLEKLKKCNPGGVRAISIC